MNKCLTEEQITYKAQGHELWSLGEEHLKECVKCFDAVAEAAREFVLQEASQAPNGQRQPRPNKMGRTHPDYLRRLVTP